MNSFLLMGILLSTYAMAAAKRIPALVGCFRAQSLLLFMVTFGFALQEKEPRLFVVAGLLFLMKVFLVPAFLNKLVKKIKVAENRRFSQTIGKVMTGKTLSSAPLHRAKDFD